MELWNYFQILDQKQKGWLFKKDNIEERLLALIKILELGYPSSIQSLIPFLKDENKEIQLTTCKVITQLFNNIETKKSYYDTLKHCDIETSDLDTYNQVFTSEECLILFSIASMNSNGYVREEAIKCLTNSNSEKAIPFIVYRLADWVPSVRKTALKCIENFIKSKYLKALVDNLTLFEWLQKVERINLNQIHSDIMTFVVFENKKYITENFKSFNDKIRISIAKLFSNSTNLKPEELNLLLSDNHFIIRNFAIPHFDKLTQQEIDILLKDKSAKIRIQVLYRLKNKNNFRELIIPFLADKSASIREFARFSLKNCISDFASIYNDNLLQKKDIIGSLSGLAETSGKKFVDNVVPFLNDKKISIRKKAFLALKQLDDSKAYIFALQNLGSDYLGIRNIIIAYFSNIATTAVLQKARDIYASGQYDLKISMLKLFSQVGKWTTIADIMIGTIDENENIRQISLIYLQQWRDKASSYFIQPTPGDLERANQTFQLTYKIHEEKRYFNQNPLTGIDFYLR